MKYNSDMLKQRLQILKDLREHGYKYIGRAEHGELRAFKRKPSKQINFWYVQGEVPYPISSAYLEDIEWRDIVPLNIITEINHINKVLIRK